MNEIVAKKTIENGEEIITLDLNKPWPSRAAGYSNYMDDVERLSIKRPRKQKKEFIKLI
jgi:hypothetical protein